MGLDLGIADWKVTNPPGSGFPWYNTRPETLPPGVVPQPRTMGKNSSSASRFSLPPRIDSSPRRRKLAGSSLISSCELRAIAGMKVADFIFFGVRRFAAALFCLFLLKTERKKAAEKRRTPKKQS
ncbi:MAG TPA: hypothetical protein VMG10_17695 [Gemmataceae bacterium]|nr:hypothetical protein [Gemmataceae bacterium]